MRLKFRRPYLSISNLEETSIADFSVITGLNGSGKTHLLKAIANGHLHVELVLFPVNSKTNDIKYFDSASMAPKDESEFGNAVAADEIKRLTESFKSYRGREEEYIAELKKVAENSLIYITSDRELSELYLALTDRESDFIEVNDKMRQDFRSTELRKSRNRILANLSDELQSLFRYFEELHRSPFFLFERKGLTGSSFIKWGSADLFESRFARLFVSYRNMSLENKLLQLRQMESDSKPGDRLYLSNDEFIGRFGPPPWDIVNDIIASSGLDFAIDRPNPFNYDPYSPRLYKKSSGAEVKLSDLSSGEKVLMSLAFCVYYAADGRQTLKVPKILLLDEVDSTLHPSMARHLVNTIQEVFIEKLKIKVVLTTHSPTTVALCPEGSVFVLSSNPHQLRSSTKAEALNLLTVGVPTIALEYRGRRQVFVESPPDSHIYEKLYEIVGRSLQPERSLEFISVGGRTGTSDMVNSGRENVKRIVSMLADNGNVSAFGLIDWDGANRTKGRVVVLAEGARDGLENAVLDPLALAGYILKLHRGLIGRFNIPPTTFIEFSNLNPELLQACSRAISNYILDDDIGQLKRCAYSGNFCIDVPAKILEMDDHRYENLVKDKMEFFRSAKFAGAGSISKDVCSAVFAEIPGIIPFEIVEAFGILLNSPAHV